MGFKRLVQCLLGIILAVPLLALVVLAFRLPITSSGMMYLVASAVFVAGLITAPFLPRRHVVLMLAGVVGIVLVAGERLITAVRYEAPSVRMLTLPQGKDTSWIGYLIDEQDCVVFGEAMLYRASGVSPVEHKDIASSIHAVYSSVRATQQVFPSAIVNTYLFRQQPESFDTLIIEPQAKRHPDTAVIFLHGFMGNVTAQCWEIAQAAGASGAVTVCPSTDWTGEWWQPRGRSILRSTFAYLRRQGIRTFYLGGYSNGGFGISRMVPELGAETGLRGLFFIDGVDADAPLKATRLPILILQAAGDQRMHASEARRAASAAGTAATCVEMDGDHFVIMKQPDAVRKALAAWLNHRLSAS